MKTLKVFMLLAFLSVLFVGIGGWLGGTGGMAIALVFALAMNVGSYWFSDRIVLKMTKAQPLSQAQAPRLYRMTERLADRAGIPMPRLYLVPDPQPNAFATGRNPENGVVAVNQGLLDLLDEREVEGVVAHEIAHIKHRDTLTMAVAAALSGAIMMLINIAQWALIFGGNDEEEGPGLAGLLVAMIVAPLAATLIQMAVSRTREYEADRTAAELTGSPDGLIGALRKLERGVERIPTATAQPATAHLSIANPLSGGGAMGKLANLFTTHPPMEKRIAALQQMPGAGRMRQDQRMASYA